MIFSCRPDLNGIWLEHTRCRHEANLKKYWFPARTCIWNCVENLWKTWHKLEAIPIFDHPKSNLNLWTHLIEWPRSGFLTLLLMVLQMAPDALGVIGLPCISYIFMNSFTHGRSIDKPYGNESTREYVKLANVRLDGRLGIGERIPLRLAHKKWTPPSQPHWHLSEKLYHYWPGLRMDFGAKKYTVIWGMWDPTLPKNPKVAKARAIG